MSSPILSIITCVKNQEKFLPELLHSVETQKALNFEHIFIDGESTDKTVSLISDYQKRNSSRYPIHVHSYPPNGIADAMNKGIEHASGTWLLFIHGDDYLRDIQATERIENLTKKHSVYDWIVGNSIRRIGNFEYSTRMFWARNIMFLLLPIINLIPHQNTVMKRALFEKFGTFRTDLPVTMDAEYYQRLLKNGVSYKSVDDGFAVFRRHSGSTSINPLNYIRP